KDAAGIAHFRNPPFVIANDIRPSLMSCDYSQPSANSSSASLDLALAGGPVLAGLWASSIDWA
ncbi:hypothetical protein H4S06_004340, partial [Coemansia sp. BCRC 34490]